jgi:hypothetical protein
MNGSFLWRSAAAAVAACSVVLLAGAARAQAVLDQWYDSSCAQTHVSWTPTGTESAQTFLAAVSGPLTRVDIFMNQNVPAAGETWTLAVRNTAAGVPTSPLAPAGVLAASTLPGALVPVLPGWATFLFGAPTTVCAGNTYALVLSTNAGSKGGFWIGTAFTNGYPQGDIWNRTVPVPGTWWNQPQHALGFRTFVGNAPYPALPAPCAPSPAPYTGPVVMGCGPSHGGSGGITGSAGEGSFAGDPPAVPLQGGEGSFGIFGSGQLAARRPVLAGPFTLSLAPLPPGSAAKPPANLQVFNVSYQNKAQAARTQATLAPSVVWLLLAGLTLGAAAALARTIQGLTSSPSSESKDPRQ